MIYFGITPDQNLSLCGMPQMHADLIPSALPSNPTFSSMLLTSGQCHAIQYFEDLLNAISQFPHIEGAKAVLHLVYHTLSKKGKMLLALKRKGMGIMNKLFIYSCHSPLDEV